MQSAQRQNVNIRVLCELNIVFYRISFLKIQDYVVVVYIFINYPNAAVGR